MTLHLRVWRRVRLFPGVTVNIGKRGVSSFSFGVRGAHYTVGRKNNRATLGLPGTGIFVTSVEPRHTKTVTSRMIDNVFDLRPQHFMFWAFMVTVAGLIVGVIAGGSP